jgi:FkbM family methyltransferase
LRLADNISRIVLESIVEYRKTFELLPLSRICDKVNRQWFAKELFVPSSKHVFVDGGSFDGDTAERFIRVNGNSYEAIHLFEVDPWIAQKAKTRLEKYERVHVHNVALSSKGEASFLSRTGLTDGHLVAADGVPVESDSLDNVVKDPITFLKLDVEGAEEGAIAGAVGHIAQDSPMLAIAAYHRAQDIWSVPGQIIGINPDYSFFLRHYTQVGYETVIYGLAK